MICRKVSDDTKPARRGQTLAYSNSNVSNPPPGDLLNRVWRLSTLCVLLCQVKPIPAAAAVKQGKQGGVKRTHHHVARWIKWIGHLR
jgi:hypothetical protein